MVSCVIYHIFLICFFLLCSTFLQDKYIFFCDLAWTFVNVYIFELRALSYCDFCLLTLIKWCAKWPKWCGNRFVFDKSEWMFLNGFEWMFLNGQTGQSGRTARRLQTCPILSAHFGNVRSILEYGCLCYLGRSRTKSLETAWQNSAQISYMTSILRTHVTTHNHLNHSPIMIFWNSLKSLAYLLSAWQNSSLTISRR